MKKINNNSQLSCLNPGDQARVLDISGCELGYRQHLLALGLRPKSVFTLLRRAPLGDPVVIQLSNGAAISLRQQEAADILLEKIN